MSKKNQFIGLIIFILIIFIFSSFSSIIGFITDYKWFSELGYTGTFLTKLKTQFLIGIPLFIGLFIVFYLYLRSLKKKYYKDANIVENKNNDKKINLGVNIGTLLISFYFTVKITSRLWFEILKFANAQNFDISDPIFGNDISFYVFKLPLISSILSYVISILFILIVLTIIFNIFMYVSRRPASGGDTIDFEEFRRRGTIDYSEFLNKKLITNVIKQIAVLGLLLLVIIGINLYLKSYDLLYSQRGKVFGAGFTDVKISLTVYRIMGIVGLISAITFFIGAKKRNLKFALTVPALLIVISIAGGIVSGVVEKFIVEPDQISKETKYIEYNIEYTQKAYGLENVKEVDFPAENNLTKQDLINNENVIKNIRINDYKPINQVYNQLQGIRSYYVFNDVDVDRYYINDEYTQVFLSARELDQNKLDSQAQTWINQYLKYTHGYGLALSPVNSVTSEGQPQLLIKNIPPTTDTNLNVTQPEIYFGEKTNDYIIVNTNEQEFDYPSGSDNIYTTYEGNAGIKLTGFNKLLFAIREGSLKLIISNRINSDSRIVINRNIVDRVNKIAPFIYYEGNPYLVLNEENGKLYWIIEGFTMSDKYPYSQPLERTTMNYIRNSVKVVIDAYNGDTDYYIADEKDPIIMTYKKIFPDLFKSMDQMPQSLREHTRYSKYYFDVQSEIYRVYHMDNPTVFFTREDKWDISKEKYMLQLEQPVESNFVMFKLPEEDNVEFLLTVPYSPKEKDNMNALFVARNDGENYGELVLYKFPKNKNIKGTNQIEKKIDNDTEISPQLTLWSQKGSNVLRGNLLVTPIEESLLYIEPIYIQADNENSLPEMKMVVVAYEDNIVMERTLDLALNKIFGDGYGETPVEEPDVDIDIDIENKTLSELIDRANDLFNKANEASKEGNWAEYGDYLDDLKDVLNKLGTISE